jgi:hypothetical protein
VSLASTLGAARLVVAVEERMSSVVTGGKTLLVVAVGAEFLSGNGLGLASESGGASEVWHWALSCSSQKLMDKNPTTNNAALLFRILQTTSSEIMLAGSLGY